MEALTNSYCVVAVVTVKTDYPLIDVCFKASHNNAYFFLLMALFACESNKMTDYDEYPSSHIIYF